MASRTWRPVILDISLARTRCTWPISQGVGRIYKQTAIGTHSSVAFAKIYTSKAPATAADLPNDGVITFFEDRGIPALSIMTDRGTEFCGALDRHPYELYLQLNDIGHTKTRARNPQTNG